MDWLGQNCIPLGLCVHLWMLTVKKIMEIEIDSIIPVPVLWGLFSVHYWLNRAWMMIIFFCSVVSHYSPIFMGKRKPYSSGCVCARKGSHNREENCLIFPAVGLLFYCFSKIHFPNVKGKNELSFLIGRISTFHGRGRNVEFLSSMKNKNTWECQHPFNAQTSPQHQRP